MKLIVCLDENNGMLFNHRRQSSDRVILEDILKTVGNETLIVNSYTAKLFSNQESLTIKPDPLKVASLKDYVFLEDGHIGEHEGDIEEILIYRWTRKYPADFFFDLDLTKHWNLVEITEFAGYSHEKIKKELYRKR